MTASAKARRKALEQIWTAAIDAVSGYQTVKNALAEDSEFQPDLIVSVGKAAVGMCQGALDRWPNCEALVVTKAGHADADIRSRKNVQVIESAHPIPDQRSLVAGQAILTKVSSQPAGSRMLLLVSGGASSLAEALPKEMPLATLQAITNEMIANGKTIGEINARRKQASLIKGGKLAKHFAGAEVRVYAISDVEGDSISTIGSGIGDLEIGPAQSSCRIIASNQIARDCAAQKAEKLGFKVRQNSETLYGDVFELKAKLAKALEDAAPGIYIWGGEPTVVLPENPGRGGRNQSLALALAESLVGVDTISVLVAGTDGSDGPTEAAGGLVDSKTWVAATAAQALADANAGVYLEACGNLFVTGPTNTNVMDLVIAAVD